MLDHERLDVYRCALELVALSTHVIGQLPRGHATVADQLRRASLSVPLNIAEACGKFTLSDRVTYFRTARGSALECAAAFDVIGLLGGGGAAVPKLQQGKQLVERLVSMLTKLAKVV